MKKVLSFALSLILIIAVVVTSMIFVSAAQTHTVTDLASLNLALENANDGDIINVIGDITNADQIEITTDVILSGTGSITFKGAGLLITDGADVIIEGGSYLSPDETTSTYLFVVDKKNGKNSSLTINDGTFQGGLNAKEGVDANNLNTITINGGKFTQDANYLINTDNSYTHTTITGGDFISPSSSGLLMVRIYNSKAKLTITGGNFTQNAAKVMLSINDNNGIIIGNPDGTGPIFNQFGNAHLMEVSNNITTTSDITIYGGTFLQDKNWGYHLEMSKSVEGKFEIAGGTFTSTGVVKGDMVRINNAGIKNFVISGGTFNQHAGEDGKSIDNAIIQKRSGTVTVKGGTYNYYGSKNEGGIIWTASGTLEGSLTLTGEGVVFNNMSTVAASIVHQSACPLVFDNFKYKAEDATQPLLNVSSTSSSPKDVNFKNSDIFTNSIIISFTGNVKTKAILDDNTKLESKGFAFENKNDSTIVLNNAKVISRRLINLNNAANGNLTMFVTAEAEKVYYYTYTRNLDKGSLTPYVEAILANGTTQKLDILETVEDKDNLMSTTVKFKTPAGLASANNLRIGVEVGSTPVTGSMDCFEVHPTDKFEMELDTDLVDIDKIRTTGALIPYSATAEDSQLMIDGGFNDSNTEIVPLSGVTFDILESKVMLFKGQNGTDKYAPSNGNAAIYQEVVVEPGKTYTLSAHIKYASAGYDGLEGQKMGLEVTYKKGSNYVALSGATAAVDPTEYKESLTFTVPADAATGANNLKVIFNFSNAFVTGYATDFSLVEVDAATGAVIGKEILKNGNFGTGNLDFWSTSGTYYEILFGNNVENFFNKVISHTPGMLKFSDSDDYARHDQEIMLKPGATYEFMYQLMCPAYNPDKVPRMILYHALYNEDRSESSSVHLDVENEEDPNVKYEVLDNNWIKMTVKTSDELRIHGHRNFTLRIYTFTASAGYFGEILVHELDANGNRIGNNLALNGDWSFDSQMWVTGNNKKYDTMEQIPGYLNQVPSPETMMYADGSASNQNYTTTITVDASKTYYFEGYYVNMNSQGVTPRVLYQSRKENGAYKVVDAELYYNTDLYMFELKVKLPDDAVVKNGQAVIRVQMNNGTKGKGYFRELLFREEGKFENLLTTMSGSATFKQMPYDAGVFVFYYDDTLFDDGDWSGELAGITKTTGAISGRVVNSKEEAVAGVQMMITGNTAVKTDENGMYSFENLKPGKYELYLVEANGNKLLCYEVEVKAGILSNIPAITYLTGAELNFEIEDTTDEDKDGDTIEQTPYGVLRGYYLDQDGKPIKGAKIYIKGLGYVVTNEKGMFEFEKLPVGEFELYTKLDDGSTHVFRKVTIEAYKGTLVKVVAPATAGGFNWLWVVIPAAAVLVLGGAALVAILVIKKKKIK